MVLTYRFVNGIIFEVNITIIGILCTFAVAAFVHWSFRKFLEEYMLRLLALNPLGKTDILFFVLCGVIVAAIVGIYFLIPLFNKKQYQEQRENLKKREASFKANLKMGGDVAAEETAEPVVADTVEQEQTSDEPKQE